MTGVASVLSLSTIRSSQVPDQTWLVNTDEDTTTRAVTRLPVRDLFEIGDPWGNPIAYFASLHYGSTRSVRISVQAADPGRMEETMDEVRATNPYLQVPTIEHWRRMMGRG